MNQLDYHCGVIDAFNEMIACGVKKMALSHPFDSSEERREILPFVESICEKYHTMYYLEDRLLTTDLFNASSHRGKWMILFYQDEEVLKEYLTLKQVKAESLRRRECRLFVLPCLSIWRTLSYPQERHSEVIEDNREKE